MGERRDGRRSKKQMEKWKYQLRRQRELNRQIKDAAGDILASSNFQKNKSFIQHGNVTVELH